MNYFNIFFLVALALAFLALSCKAIKDGASIRTISPVFGLALVFGLLAHDAGAGILGGGVSLVPQTIRAKTRPTCSQTTRGTTYDAFGTPDRPQICASLTTSGAPSWRSLTYVTNGTLAPSGG